MIALIAVQSRAIFAAGVRTRAMASLTIRRLDDDLKQRLRLRAARNGRSMEDEARIVLGEAARGEDGDSGLGTAMRRRPVPRSPVKREQPSRTTTIDQPSSGN